MKTENKQNPDKALRAILASDTEIKLSNGNTINIKPLNISTFAMLDMIKSPILYPEDKELSIYDYFPSFYVVIVGFKEAQKKDNLYTAAFDYFDELGIKPTEIDSIKNAVLKQVYLATELSPEESTEDKKK